MLNAVVRGVKGWKPGVGGMFLNSHNFSLCETGESSSSIAFLVFLVRYFSFASLVGKNADHIESAMLKTKMDLYLLSVWIYIFHKQGTHSMRMLAAKAPFAMLQLCLFPDASAKLQLFVMYHATLLGCSGSEWSGPA